MRDNLSLKTGESVHGQGVGKLYNATSFKSIETHEFLTIVQRQPNYIKKVYSELVNTNNQMERSYMTTLMLKKQKLIFKNLRKAIR